MPDPPPVRIELKRFPDEELGPVSFTEAGLFRLVTRDPDPRPYNFVFPLAVLGSVSPTVLETAFRVLIARHDVLRTGFSATADGPVRRRVESEAPFVLQRAELSGQRADQQIALLHEHIRELRRQPVDLAQPPLMAVRLVQCAGGPILLWRLHHLVLDGWSAYVLLRELCMLLEGLPGGTVRLDAIPIRAADYGASMATAYGPLLQQGSAAYPQSPKDPWRLRLDRPHPPALESTAARVIVPLPTALDRALEKGSGRAAALFMGAYAVALARHSERSDVAYTLVQGNRRDSRLFGTVGYLVHGDTVQIDVGGRPTGAEVERRAREVLRASRSGWAPYNVLVQPPSMRVLLNLHYTQTTHHADALLLWRPDLEPEQHLFAVHDLVMQVSSLRGGRLLVAGYRPAVLDAGSVERLVEELIAALESMMDRPDSPLDTPEPA